MRASLPSSDELPDWFARAADEAWPKLVRRAFSAFAWQCESNRMACWEDCLLRTAEACGVELPSDLVA